MLASRLAAADLYWDADAGASATTGGTGSWDVTSVVWRLSGSAGTLQAYDNSSPSSVVARFGGTAGTVTTSGTINLGSANFGVGGYTVTGGTLNLVPATAPFSFATNGGTTTINSALSSAGGTQIAKTGAGTLHLGTGGGGASGSPALFSVTGGSLNSGTGIFDSILSMQFGSALGVQAGSPTTVLTLDAGTLRITGTGSNNALAANRRVQINSAGGSITDSGGGLFYQAPIINNAGSGSSLHLSNASGTTQYQGIISGTGSVTWNGAGTVSFQAANTYSGGTIIRGGTVAITNNSSLGSGSVTLNEGAALANNDSVAHTLANSFALNGSTTGSTFTGSQKLTLSGTISSASAVKVSKTGASVLTLSADNSGTLAANSNWNVTGGTFSSATGLYDNVLALNSGRALGNSSGCVLNLNAGTLRFTVNGGTGYANTRTINVLSGGGSIDDGGFAFGEATGGGGSVNPGIVVSPGAGLNLVASNKLQYSGTISGSGGISTYGTGTIILSNSSSFSGGTSVKGGTLIIGNAGALGSTTASLAVTNGTLNLGGLNVTAGALNLQNGSIIGLNPSGGGLSVSSATCSGTNFVGLSGAVSSSGTINLINSSGGGLTGTFQFSGGQDLTVPVTSLVTRINGGFYRMSLQGSGSSLQLQTASNSATAISITSLGASISSGTSSLGVAKNGTSITSYNGGGYRSQWYQNLVNDGRFNPSFVGSDNNLQANNPSGVSVLTVSGQTQSEGHPGYRTSQTLYNLNHNGGDGGNNGGFWLAPGNGRNPDYIALNVGGNDLSANPTDSQAVRRYDAILSELNDLRPGVTTLMSTMMYRTDSGAAINQYFNPFVQGAVYNHTLAGENVRFVDLYSLFSPGDSQANLSADGIHPTQAGYNQMGNAWYHATVYGAAFWTGELGGSWNSVAGADTNWAMNPARTLDRQKPLNDSTANTYFFPDVFFNGNPSPIATTLGADTTIRSLNFAAGASGAVSVGGAQTLTIGAGGITVQQGSGSHSLSANVVISADQTWGNVSSNPFTVSGNVSGSKSLTFAGAYTVYAAGPIVSGTVATVATTFSGTGIIELTGTNTYTGRTSVSSGTLVVSGGGISGGTVGQTIVVNDTGTGTATLTQSGGAISAGSGEIWIGQNSGSTGIYNLSAGTLTSSNWLAVGRNVATGVLNLTGGTLTHAGNNVTIGAGGGGAGNGTVNQTGGTFNDANELWIGEGGTANYNMSGGTVNANGGVKLSRGSNPGTLTLQGSTGNTGSLANGGGNETFSTTNVSMSEGSGASTIHLDGGTLVANRIQSAGGAGSKIVNFNGGTLKVGSNGNATFMAGITSAFVKSGNAFIDTNGKSITISQPLLTDAVSTGGGLIKNGAGRLTLAAANTYTGATEINSGTLIVNGSLGNQSAVTVKVGTSLSGTGTINGPVTTVGGTSIVAPGDAAIGTLRTGTTRLTGILAAEINASASDTLQVAGDLDITNASVAFTSLAAPGAVKYVIVKYSGALTGTFESSTVPSGYELNYDAAAKEIQLVISGFQSFMGGFPDLSAADRLPAADPDQDGLSNLLEYALADSDPTRPGANPAQLADGALSFRKRSLAVSAGDIAYFIEASATLGEEPDPWTVVTPTVNDNATISYQIPTGAIRLFARLRVVQN